MSAKLQAYSYFETGDIPTEAQFQFVFNNIWWKDEKMSVTDINGLNQALQGMVTSSQFNSHITDTLAHSGTLALLDASNLTAVHVNAWKDKLNINYVATIDGGDTLGNVFTKEQIQAIVEGLKSQDDEALLLLEQLREMLTSDDVNLDELQEIVDYIKENRAEIDLLKEVIIGSTKDDKIQLVGTYSNWGAITYQNQFNDLIYEKIQNLETAIPPTGKTVHEEKIRVDSKIKHDLDTYRFIIDAYDTVTMYNVPIRWKRMDENNIAVEFDTLPPNFIQITIKKI
ncbi:hypothetical protein [Chryseobacterium sp.]|uniref:hypothetical protein n=1 Tax=Chryseobacterium sp. TaxID=1871047 RepID=UPI00289CD9FC|nr:hypothetical protein [Chryseobacterium sp.]